MRSSASLVGLFAFVVAVVTAACTNETPAAQATGGSPGIGGQSSSGGKPSGGATVGSGGIAPASGGTTGTGGAALASGGIAQTGGSASGGRPTGGAASSGGVTTGGKAAGGSATGGKAAGGNDAGHSPTLKSSTADPTYATSGPWHGYIWPAVDSGGVATISPSASQGFRSGGPPYCVSGHVPATPNSTAVAMVGMNTNQDRSGGAVAAPWTPTGTGILVNVSNPGGSPLRLQIQTNETGAVAQIWCAMITQFDQDVIVRWSDFKTACWNNSGSTFDQSLVGIATVMVLVPGTAQTGGYDFSFCVNDMTPV
jgi:hypothetical protein